MKAELNALLASLEDRPVLVDIGASGSAPSIWDPIARQSLFVGFDPDLRELHEAKDGKYLKAVTVNEAVVAGERGGEARFFFTRSPYCSSSLPPDPVALSDYVFSELFIVEREAMVPASRLDSVLKRLSLDRVDWLKVDSQGTDLQIFTSLPEAIRSKVLALDIEPGLIDAYAGEDHFVDAHRELTRGGFWLSDLNVRGTARMRKSTLDNIRATRPALDYPALDKAIRHSPAWCESRYFRTLEWLERHEARRRDYLLLWVFAMLDRQWGFAIDLALDAERILGKSEEWTKLRDMPLDLIQGWVRTHRCQRPGWLPRRVARRLLAKFKG